MRHQCVGRKLLFNAVSQVIFLFAFDTPLTNQTLLMEMHIAVSTLIYMSCSQLFQKKTNNVSF